MTLHKKIALIGGTGKSGHFLTQQLINHQIPFKMLLRDPAKKIPDNPLVENVLGDAADFKDIYKLLTGCTCVLSMLGLGTPPSEPDIFSTSTSNILKAMNKHGIKRYVVITGLSVDTAGDTKGPFTQAATRWMYDNFPLSTNNKQQEYELLRQSTTDWTMIRLPQIRLLKDQMETRADLQECPGQSISATDLALFIISQIDSSSYFQRAPFLANPLRHA